MTDRMTQEDFRKLGKAIQAIDIADSTKDLADQLAAGFSILDYDKVNELFAKLDDTIAGHDVLTALLVIIHLAARGLVKADKHFTQFFREEGKQDPDLGAALGLLIGSAYRSQIEQKLDTSARDKVKK